MPWADGTRLKRKPDPVPEAPRLPSYPEKVRAALRPVGEFPVLFRWNGIGLGLYGRLSDYAIPHGCLNIYFISVFGCRFCLYASTP